jgi:hypothetical protein
MNRMIVKKKYFTPGRKEYAKWQREVAPFEFAFAPLREIKR